MEKLIIISRHAARRMQLYKINKSDIINLIKTRESEIIVGERQNFVFNIQYYNYPLKMILTSSEKNIIIISVYPLKGKLK